MSILSWGGLTWNSWQWLLSVDLWISLFLVGFGLLAMLTGGWLSYVSHFQHPRWEYIPVDDQWSDYLGKLVAQAKEKETNQASLAERNQPKIFSVDVAGGVEKPGVYELDSQARIGDAIKAAGGFSKLASQQFIHQDLNLAQRIEDQQKIYIPLQGENLGVTSAAAGTGSKLNSEKENSCLVVNQASAQQLEELPNIGPKRAEDILAGIPYLDKEDFLQRSGLSTNLAQELMAGLICF